MWKQAQYLQMKEHSVLSLQKVFHVGIFNLCLCFCALIWFNVLIYLTVYWSSVSSGDYVRLVLVFCDIKIDDKNYMNGV